MQSTMRIARRCTALLLPRALPLGQTDRRIDGQTQRRFNMPNLRPGPQNLKIDRVILITPTWGQLFIGGIGLHMINQYKKI